MLGDCSYRSDDHTMRDPKQDNAIRGVNMPPTAPERGKPKQPLLIVENLRKYFTTKQAYPLKP